MPQRLHGPPVILLGGDGIALSVARSLAPHGVRVFALAPPGQIIQFSRYAEWIRLPGRPAEFRDRCAEFLTGPQSDDLAGAVLLATQDEAVLFIADHREALRGKFLLDRSNPRAQRLMLDKIGTYLAAREAGVPTPRFWIPRAPEDLPALARDLVFPLIVKPRFSHLFRSRFGSIKHFIAHDLAAAAWALDQMERAGLEGFLVEKIPGPDNLSSSYYTWLDTAGRARFHFTKRVIRRHPKNMGQTCAHVSGEVPCVGEQSLRLLRHVGLQGIANLEHKFDPRDGVHKLIECNARFSGGNPLVLGSGVNIAELVYCEATGQPPPRIGGFRRGVRMWHPREDFAAFRELRALGEITLWQWLGSILHPKTRLPVWSWRDPGPSVMPFIRRLRRRLAALWRRLRGRSAVRAAIPSARRPSSPDAPVLTLRSALRRSFSGHASGHAVGRMKPPNPKRARGG